MNKQNLTVFNFAVIVIFITLIALYFTEETYHKDLN